MENKKSQIIITEPVLGDEEGIAYVHKQTWLETYPNEERGINKNDILLKDFDSEEKLEKWRNRIKENGTGGAYVCVAKNDGKVVGVCMAAKGGKYNELKIIYVLPQYQGMGIGTKLAESALKWLGVEKDIILDVVDYNSNAIAFYKKIGFLETMHTSKCEFPNGKNMQEIRMIMKSQ